MFIKEAFMTSAQMIKREKFKKYTWNIVITILFYVDLEITFTIR